MAPPPRSSRSRTRAAAAAPPPSYSALPSQSVSSGVYDFLEHIPSPAVVVQPQQQGSVSRPSPGGPSEAYDFLDHIPSTAVVGSVSCPSPSGASEAYKLLNIPSPAVVGSVSRPSPGGVSDSDAYSFLDNIPSSTFSRQEQAPASRPSPVGTSGAYDFLDQVPSPAVVTTSGSEAEQPRVDLPQHVAAQPRPSAVTSTDFIDHIPASQRVTFAQSDGPSKGKETMDIDLPGDVSGPESEEGVGTAVTSFASTMTAEDVGRSEPTSPILSIEELLASATDLDGPSTSYLRPEMEQVDLEIPPRLLLRLQKSRYMISELMKELAEIRRALYELNDRLHRIDVVVQNTLRKMF